MKSLFKHTGNLLVAVLVIGIAGAVSFVDAGGSDAFSSDIESPAANMFVGGNGFEPEPTGETDSAVPGDNATEGNATERNETYDGAASNMTDGPDSNQSTHSESTDTDSVNASDNTGGNETEDGSGRDNRNGAEDTDDTGGDDEDNDRTEQQENIGLSDPGGNHTNITRIVANWSMTDTMSPDDSTTSSLTLRSNGTEEFVVFHGVFIFNVSGCETDVEGNDSLCEAANMSSFLEMENMTYNGHVFDMAPDTGDFDDVNSNGRIDFEDLADSANAEVLSGLDSPSNGVEALTIGVTFNSREEDEREEAVVDISLGLLQAEG